MKTENENIFQTEIQKQIYSLKYLDGWSISCDKCNNHSSRKKGGFSYTRLPNCFYCNKPFSAVKGGPVYSPTFVCIGCKKQTDGKFYINWFEKLFSVKKWLPNIHSIICEHCNRKLFY